LRPDAAASRERSTEAKDAAVADGLKIHDDRKR
jgi:hypothetical protein